MRRHARPISLTLSVALLLASVGAELGHVHCHTHAHAHADGSHQHEGHDHASHCGHHHHNHWHQHTAPQQQHEHPAAPCHDENDCAVCRYLIQSATTVVFDWQPPVVEPTILPADPAPARPYLGPVSFRHSRAPPKVA